MKRILSDSSQRNLTPPSYPQWVQQENIQTNQPNNEHYTVALQPLTDELYAQLIDPLSKQDFERAMQIAGVRNLSELFQLADTNQRTLLMLAGMRGDVELIKIILTSTSNPDMFASMTDANGWTPLIYAITNRKYESVKILLEGVSNPEQLIFMKNDVNNSALTLAINKSVISDLYGDYESIHHHPEMCERENKKQAELVKTLLSYVSDKDALICNQRVDGREILNYVLRFDNAELLKILLDSVNNPEELLTMKDSEGKNLLMNAASGAKSKSILVILRSVNNPEAFVMMKDSGGMTALMHAIESCEPEPIKTLLENVKNPEQLIFMKNNLNNTALMLAIKQSTMAELLGDYDYLIEHFPEMLEKDNKQKTESVKILLSYVSDKDALIYKKDINDREILNYALHMDNTELLKILLDIVDNPEELLAMKDAQGKNLLMNAASSYKVKSIKFILSFVKNPEAFAMIKDSEGMTALMHAIMSGDTKSIKAILRNVKNPDQLALMKNQNDYNALMLEAIVGSYYTTKALLNHVKNPAELIYSTDSKGATALMLCCQHQDIENIDSNSITVMLEKAKTIPYPYYKFSPTYSKGKNSYIPLNLDSLIFIKNTKWMNAFMIALTVNNIRAALTLLNSTTDILRLFSEENLEQCTVIDLFHKEYGVDMCDALIERVEQLQISNNSEDLDTVMWLLQERKARFH